VLRWTNAALANGMGAAARCPLTGRRAFVGHMDPQNAERRRRAASRGGRAKANQEIRTIKDEIKATIEDVTAGFDRNKARVMFTGWSVLLDYIKLERNAKVEDELAAELEEVMREITGAS
jgi:hypothetical protein